MGYALVFWCVSAACAYQAVTAGGWQLALVWPALSFALAGGAYAGLGPKVFGKRADGSLSPLPAAALLPYLLYTWGLWHCGGCARAKHPITSCATAC